MCGCGRDEELLECTETNTRPPAGRAELRPHLSTLGASAEPGRASRQVKGAFVRISHSLYSSGTASTSGCNTSSRFSWLGYCYDFLST